MTSLECAQCRLRWRKARLCVDHFFDFLGWLTVLGQESVYWLGSRRQRLRLVTSYRTNPEDLEAALDALWQEYEAEVAA